jgi:signal transduction histidine kinase
MRILLFALISLILPGFSAIAQQERLIIAQYNTDNGLPQNSVKDIAFDKWGYCWLATEMGMVRYDGQRFVTYGTTEVRGLESERIEGLTASATGVLNARVYGGQVLRIAVPGKNAAPGPVLLPKWSVHVGQNGIAIENKLMLRKLHYFYNHLGTSPLPRSLSVSDDEVYMGSPDSLMYFSSTRETPLKIMDYIGQRPHYTIFGGYLVICILPGNRIDAWKNGAHLPAYKSVSGPLASDPRFLAGDFRNFPATDGIYVYSSENLYKVSLRDGRLNSEIVLRSIRIPSISCVRFVPEQNSYYFGSETDGLFVVRKSAFGAPPFAVPTLNESLYAQADAGDGQLIVRNLVVSPDKKPRQLPINNEIAAWLFSSGDGHMYYGQDYMLRKLNIQSGKVLDITTMESRFVYMGTAPDGHYMFAANKGFGRLVNDKVVDFKKFPEKTVVLFARQLRPWHFLVCTENGLKWYDYKRNRVYKSVLNGVQVRMAYLDGPDKIWISSYGKGFYFFEKSRLYRMPLGPKQALKTVHSFIEDGHGFFWLPSNNGLFKVRKEDLTAYAKGKADNVYFFRFDRNDGLPTNEFNGGCDPSYLWLKDSVLSLPTIKGLVWFRPGKLRPYYPRRGIFADSLTVNSNSRPIVPGTKEITLTPDFKRLSVQISSPYFGNPDNLGLEYQVAGLDGDWHKVEKNGQVTIGSLPAGNYKLLVRRNRGQMSGADSGFELPIYVKPWFYNTWWFYLFCICTSVFLGYLLFKRRFTKLEREAQQLEKVISDRTHELKNAVEDLARSEMALLESNRFKDHVITMVLHDMRSPLRFISLISGNLLKNHTRLAPDDLDGHLSDLHMGTQNLMGFTEQFFMWVSAQREGFRVSKTLFSLNELFDEIASLYMELFKVNHNTLTIIHSDLACISDYQILSVVIRNLIDNANKNTYEGEIVLSCRQEDDRIFISMTDTGMGLTSEQIALFMSRDRLAANRGTGSLLIHTMLDYIQGALSITSEPGQGSTFTITLQNLRQYDTFERDGSIPANS